MQVNNEPANRTSFQEHGRLNSGKGRCNLQLLKRLTAQLRAALGTQPDHHWPVLVYFIDTT
jgi:hypothetical protein